MAHFQNWIVNVAKQSVADISSQKINESLTRSSAAGNWQHFGQVLKLSMVGQEVIFFGAHNC